MSKITILWIPLVVASITHAGCSQGTSSTGPAWANKKIASVDHTWELAPRTAERWTELASQWNNLAESVVHKNADLPTQNAHQLLENGVCEAQLCAQSFTLLEMTPTPESRRATPISKILLRFNLDVDPSTIDHINLFERESKREVPTRLDVIGDTVTMTPSVPLSSNAAYTVRGKNVLPLQQSVGPTDFAKRFFTQSNFERVYIKYNESGEQKAHVYHWDGETRQQQIDHLLPGTDETLLTEDDRKYTQVISIFNEEMDQIETDVRASSGPDETYGTQDDTRLYTRINTWDGVGMRSRTHFFYGTDYTQGTEDDYRETELRSYDEEDRLISICTELRRCTRYLYLEEGRIISSWTHPGEDETWNTQDDVIAPTFKRQFLDTHGNVTWTGNYRSSAQFSTSDAFLESYTTIHRNDYGLPQLIKIYTNPGPDGNWKTGDDVSIGRLVYTYDQDGWRRTQKTYNSGPDNIASTADDQLVSFTTYQAYYPSEND